MPKNKTSSGDDIDDMVADIYSRFVVHKGINDLDLSRKERSALQGIHTGDPKTMERIIKKALLSVKEETEMTDYDQLDEWGLSGGDGDAYGGEIDANDLFDLSSKDVLQRLNTFVKSVNDRTYVNPSTPLARIREKLSVLGIGVEMIPLVGQTGSIELPLRQWGGIFDPYTGVTEDGISDKTEDGNGLNLSLSWSVGRNGRYTIDASIESAAVEETEVDADAAAVEEEFKAAYDATVSERMDPEVFKQKLSDLAKKNDMDKTVARNKADQKRKDKEREDTAGLDEIKFSGRSSIKYKVAKKIQRGIQSVVAKSSTGKERGLQTPQDRKADLDSDRETRKNFGGKASKIRFKSGNGSKLLKVPASKLSAKKLQGMKSEDAEPNSTRFAGSEAGTASRRKERIEKQAASAKKIRAARTYDNSIGFGPRKEDTDDDAERWGSERHHRSQRKAKRAMRDREGSERARQRHDRGALNRLRGRRRRDEGVDGVDERITYGSGERAKQNASLRAKTKGDRGKTPAFAAMVKHDRGVAAKKRRATRSHEGDQDRASAERKDRSAGRLKARRTKSEEHEVDEVMSDIVHKKASKIAAKGRQSQKKRNHAATLPKNSYGTAGIPRDRRNPRDSFGNYLKDRD